ncbi:MAG: AAA family ATPase [Deltaproteobacteria bacterium]|nr:AAA family ATPase [Deltaproteobacteria bacterium]
MDAVIQEISLMADSGYPLLYLLTHEEERAKRLVESAMQSLERTTRVWSRTGGADQDPIALLASVPDAGSGATLLLDFHPFLEDPRVIRRLRDAIEPCSRNGHMLVVISPVLVLPPELEKDASVMELPLPSREELDRQFRQICVEEQVLFPEDFIGALIRAAQGLTEKEARRVFTKALRKGGGFKLDDISLVIEEKKKSLRKSQILEYFELDESLATVGGLEELKRWLHSRARAFGESAEAFGLPPPKGLLLIGVQGCGKSLTAKAVAGSWHLPLVRLDLSAAFGTSSPEASVRLGFRVAESLAPVVLWVDEIEKGFAEVGGEAGQSATRVFGSFITWMQEKKAPVFVVATANEVDRLPPELLRKGRFDETFFVDLPDVHERSAILRIHLQRRGRDPAGYDVEALAARTEHYSGAEIEQAILAGLFRAFDQDRELETADIEREVGEIVPLYDTYEEKIKALRDWAKKRARRASLDSSLVDLFERE